MTVAQPVVKFTAFCVTQRIVLRLQTQELIAVLSGGSIPQRPTLLSETHFNIYFPLML